MRKISKSKARSAAPSRALGYLIAIATAANAENDTHWFLPEDAFAEIQREYAIVPSVGEQLRTALQAAREYAASGFKTVSEADVARRLAVCQDCPEWQPTKQRCLACGCTRLKHHLPDQQCPRGLWN